MKVLTIAPVPFFVDRGTPIRILKESLFLSRKGHSIDIATYHLGSSKEELGTGVKIHRIPPLLFWYKKTEAGPSWQKIILDFFLLIKVCCMMSFNKYDIIHAHLHEGVFLGWIIKKIFFWKKVKLIADFHGSLSGELRSHKFLKLELLKKFFVKLERFINNLGDFSIASSEELGDLITSQGIKNKLRVILDGVDAEKYRDFCNKKSEIRRELGVPDNKLVFVYSGSFVFNKGIDYLIDFIDKNKQKNFFSECFFIIAGSPLSEIDDFYARRQDLRRYVKIISPLSYADVARVNSAGDLAIDPKDKSVFQASGKILEYMAAGLPVICWKKENNIKYLEEGGFYIENNFSEEFSAFRAKSAEKFESLNFH
ncbi:glycosyltransferase family 4 protein, partial [Patescibacteria group bacterium]